jgi:uncharacterized membrane protein YagU involved in acid resistance
MKGIIRNGFAGIVATGAMSLVMLAGKAVGLMETAPPKQITHHAEQKAGIRPHEQPQEAFDATWLAAHVGYGAACGVVFGLLRPVLPRNRVIAGLIFGELVWAVSYLGYLPAIGLYPSPKQDSGSRQAVMIAAHAVYGVSQAYLEG